MQQLAALMGTLRASAQMACDFEPSNASTITINPPDPPLLTSRDVLALPAA
jgi:hypothetical protein